MHGLLSRVLKPNVPVCAHAGSMYIYRNTTGTEVVRVLSVLSSATVLVILVRLLAMMFVFVLLFIYKLVNIRGNMSEKGP